MIKLIIITVSLLVVQLVSSQSNQTIENLKAFSKAYGYVKYYHPSDEAYDINWKNFAVYGAKEVEHCKNNKELVEVLNRVFKPIAPASVFVLKEDKLEYDFNIITPQKASKYDQVYWQHCGVSYKMKGDGIRGFPYKSRRINKKDFIDQTALSGQVRTSLDPKSMRGKEFKYEGWAKLKEGSEGKGYFWILVDREDEKRGYFNKTMDTPVINSQWEKFTIKGKIDTNAVNLFFGCYLVDKGSLLVDNIQLSYKEGDEWVNVPVKNGDFEQEKISSMQKESTAWYGQGKGYKVGIEDKDKYTGKRSVRIDYVGDFKKLNGKPIFDCRPQFGEIIEKELSTSVLCQIPLVLYANKKGTYPESDVHRIEQLRNHISKTPLSSGNLHVRLGNVIISHNVFRHFYPYFDVVNVDWNDELERALRQSFIDKNNADHLKTLRKLTAKLQDGHIKVLGYYNERYVPPILWEWIGSDLVITHVMDESVLIKPGDVIKKVNGTSPENYFKNSEELISAATRGWLNHRAQSESLYGTKGSTLKLHVDTAQYEIERNYTFNQVYQSSKIKSKKYKLFKDSSVVYLNLDLIDMEEINAIMPMLQQSEALICDMRGHPRGTVDLISHFLKEDLNEKPWLHVPQFIYPDQNNICGYEEHGWNLKAKIPYLGDKQVIFIIDGRAISAAESYLSFVEGYDLATIIGQPSAGTNGNVNLFELLDGYKVAWTGMKVIKHDGTQHHGVGIIPDVKVEKTIDGVKEGRDEFLEKALELVK